MREKVNKLPQPRRARKREKKSEEEFAIARPVIHIKLFFGNFSHFKKLPTHAKLERYPNVVASKSE